MDNLPWFRSLSWLVEYGSFFLPVTETTQVFPCHLQLLFLRRDTDGTIWRCHQQGLCQTKSPTSLRLFSGGFSSILGSLPPVDLFLPLYSWLRLVCSFPREEVLPPPGDDLLDHFLALSFSILTGFISCSSPSLHGPMWPCSVWSPRAT